MDKPSLFMVPMAGGNNSFTTGNLCRGTVIGTASPRHHETLRAQGVQPIDYNDIDLAGSVLKLAPVA
ncbi:hypothetical protein ACFOG5_24455 [Pedobacter fastidiosus]|uniref:hypothetical protein n=1 Tax=Pedobacter fastidiosus TaxID=2765361 RepID=UPI00360FEFF3